MAKVSQFFHSIDDALIEVNAPWVEPWRLSVSDGDRMRFAMIFMLAFVVASVLELVKRGHISAEGFVIFGLLALAISYSMRAISRS